MDAITRSFITAVAVVALGQAGSAGRLAAQTPAPQTRQVPMFEPDPSWPKLPSKYVWGQVSSVSIDDQGHAWILQRPSTVRADQKSMAAPPVLEFDEAGNFIQGWGGPGPGYDWPQTEHGIYADPKGFIWLGGNGNTDHHLVKFTRDGKFVMQRFIDRYCEAPHCGNGQTVASTAFSPDPEQKFLYVASRSPARLWILDRATLTPLDSFGRNGIAPGEFYVMHHMNVDSKGNLYVTEVQDGKRIQKFVFKGMVPAPTH